MERQTSRTRLEAAPFTAPVRSLPACLPAFALVARPSLPWRQAHSVRASSRHPIAPLRMADWTCQVGTAGLTARLVADAESSLPFDPNDLDVELHRGHRGWRAMQGLADALHGVHPPPAVHWMA